MITLDLVQDAGFWIALVILVATGASLFLEPAPSKLALWVKIIAVLGSAALLTLTLWENSLQEQEMEQLRLKAEPTQLRYVDCRVGRDGGNLVAVFRFMPVKNEQMGLLGFRVTLEGESEARVLRMEGTSGMSGKNVISDDGRHGLISFTPFGVVAPKITITVSGPCRLRVRGTHFDGEVVEDISE